MWGVSRELDQLGVVMGVFANLVLAAIFLLPLLFTVWMYKKVPPRYMGQLLYAAAFILLASIEAGSLNESITYLGEQMKAQKPAQLPSYKQAIAELGLWAGIVPVVAAAIGANLITQFLITPKPVAKSK